MRVEEELRHLMQDLEKGHGDDEFILRGLWKTQLLFRPNEKERIFEYTYLLAQTVGQGCSYCCDRVCIDREWIGQDARRLESEHGCMRIAVLDAIFSVFDRQPAKTFFIEGTSISKTRQRTEIVVEQVMSLLDSISARRRPRVVNVGAVGNIILSLLDKGVEVYATDLDENLIGREVGGVRVEDGDRTIPRVAESDLALVTGMTLPNGSINGIYDTAKASGTKLVMFNETGANLGEALCRLGIDCVVSEPFPFYIFQGQSRIDVYRRELR
jgi:uncharacterized UPF0146 family protein